MQTKMAQCTAPVNGHSSVDAERDCPVHGAGRGPVPSPKAGAPRIGPSIHREANADFDPTEYTFIRAFDMNTLSSRAAFNAVETEVEWADDVPYGEKCSHCGSRLRYVAMLKHSSGQHITVGETCLGDRFSVSKEEFRKARELGKAETKRIEREFLAMAREEQAAALREARFKAQAERLEEMARVRAEMFEHNPGLELVTYPEMFAGRGLEGFASSLNHWMRENNTLTDNQIGSFLRATQDDLARIEDELAEARMRQELLDEGFAAPVGEGIRVRGVVSSIKTSPNPFGSGSITKMRVSLPGGVGVLATVPASISGVVGEGATVEFTANFALSKTNPDPLFSFAKNPKQARVVDGDEE